MSIAHRTLSLALFGACSGGALPSAQGQSFVQETYFKASNTEPQDHFGGALALSGDTLVVAALREASASAGVDGNQADNSLASAGAAYVFVLEGSTWTQQAYLKASNPGLHDSFGETLAVSGDTIVVGVPDEDSDATGVDGDGTSDAASRAGAAYVFVRQGTTWIQQAYLKASNTEALDMFGASVSISGDTIVVGAPQESSDATGIDGDQGNNARPLSGAAYVFVREGSTWTQQAYVKASNTGLEDRFGGAVAVDGNLLVVGAWNETSWATGIDGDQGLNGILQAGAAYAFVRVGATWTQEAYIKASNTDWGDRFGANVVLSGDTLLVAAPYESSAATGIDGDQDNNDKGGAGAVYAFVREGSTWSQQAYIKASNTDVSDQFGTSIAISGDLAIVGAPYENGGSTGINGDDTSDAAPDTGSAYVFVREDSRWSQLAYVKASNAEDNTMTGNFAERFGLSVGASGSLLAAGATGEDSSATGIDGDEQDNGAIDSGAAYGFRVGPACVSYCSSLPNATGSPALLSCRGVPGSTLAITSSPVPNSTGQFFFGPAMLAGNPFGDGLLCVGGMTRRLVPLVVAGMMMQPANTAEFTLDHAAPYATGLTGTQHFQHWFRSTLAAGAGFNTSDAVTVEF